MLSSFFPFPCSMVEKQTQCIRNDHKSRKGSAEVIIHNSPVKKAQYIFSIDLYMLLTCTGENKSL